jgi:hypothetical protein
MITGAQKNALRQHGYTDEQIREMRPEDAHRILQEPTPEPRTKRKRPKKRRGPLVGDIDTSA